MHWKNSNFQILYFIVGKCFTADEAYRILCQLKEDREAAITSAKIGLMKDKKALMRINNISVYDEESQLEYDIQIAELGQNKLQLEKCYNQAIRELDFIDFLINKINPYRKYKEYPDHVAHQLCQEEEWEYKLIHKAKINLLSQGFIPCDLMETMMAHPAWEDKIGPVIKQAQENGRIEIKPEQKFLEFYNQVLEEENK